MTEFIFAKVEKHQSQLMEQIYRLRYQVYGMECGFINPQDYPSGMETDEYDDQSVHFAALHPEDGEVIGTLRMILPGKLPLPIQLKCKDVKVDHATLPQLSFSEISRLVISKKLRRRKNDAMYYEPQVEDQKGVDVSGQEFLRRARPMAFGIYRELYHESKRLGVTHWYSIMEKSLWLLLRLHGFRFEQIGQEIDFYGPVSPYIGKIAQIEQEVQQKFPQFYQYFVNNSDHSSFNSFKI
jgi:N-acyl amino acid synthase of PEP-CTERM/exosortase system